MLEPQPETISSWAGMAFLDVYRLELAVCQRWNRKSVAGIPARCLFAPEPVPSSLEQIYLPVIRRQPDGVAPDVWLLVQ